MKQKLIALLIGFLTVTPVITLAKGPYNSLNHRKDGVSSTGDEHVLAKWDGGYNNDALEIKNKGGKIFVQWWTPKGYTEVTHTVCQCTDDMNAEALASKQSEGWVLWGPGASDPRYNWCSNNQFICKPW